MCVQSERLAASGDDVAGRARECVEIAAKAAEAALSAERPDTASATLFFAVTTALQRLHVRACEPAIGAAVALAAAGANINTRADVVLSFSAKRCASSSGSCGQKEPSLGDADAGRQLALFFAAVEDAEQARTQGSAALSLLSERDQIQLAERSLRLCKRWRRRISCLRGLLFFDPFFFPH
jgi:hypothetical protein